MKSTITERPPEKRVTKFNCPNKANHVSAYPAYDRVPCPFCTNGYELPVYIQAAQGV